MLKPVLLKQYLILTLKMWVELCNGRLIKNHAFLIGVKLEQIAVDVFLYVHIHILIIFFIVLSGN